jgi:hypothetical protein
MYRKRLLLLLTIIGAMLLVACNGGETTASEAPIREELVTFVAKPSVNAAEEVVIDFSLHNGGEPLPADKNFIAHWRLERGDGEMRAQGKAHDRPALPGGAETPMMRWSGSLEPGDYTLTWGAPGLGATVIDFAVQETEHGLQIGSQQIRNTTAYPTPGQ